MPIYSLGGGKLCNYRITCLQPRTTTTGSTDTPYTVAFHSSHLPPHLNNQASIRTNYIRQYVAQAFVIYVL